MNNLIGFLSSLVSLCSIIKCIKYTNIYTYVHKHRCVCMYEGFPGSSVVKNPPANAGDSGDAGSVLGSGRSLGGGNSNLFQYSSLENSMDRGAWQAVVHGVTKSRR